MTGLELKELRKSAGLTQQQLAKLCGLSSEKVITNYESDDKKGSRNVTKPMEILFKMIISQLKIFQNILLTDKEIERESFEMSIDYKPFDTQLSYKKYYEYGYEIGAKSMRDLIFDNLEIRILKKDEPNL